MHQKTVIGENCTIYQHMTFGAAHGEKETDGATTLGNNVMFGVEATILGRIRIGNNASIGAQAVVIHDIQDNAVVVGLLATVIIKY